MYVAKNTLRGESVAAPPQAAGQGAERSENYFIKKGIALFDKVRSEDMQQQAHQHDAKPQTRHQQCEGQASPC